MLNEEEEEVDPVRERERERGFVLGFFVVCPRSISSPQTFFSLLIFSRLFILFVGTLCLVRKYLNDTILRLLLSYDKDTYTTTSRFDFSNMVNRVAKLSSRLFILFFFFFY